MIGPGWHWDRERGCMQWVGIHDVTPMTEQDPSRPGWWRDEQGDHYIQPPVGAPLCPAPGATRSAQWLDGLPAAVVGVPDTLGISLFEDSGWYYVAAYEYEPFSNSYRRLYSRGPMWLSSSAAEEEFFNTVDSYWGKAVFMWKWDGSGWRLEKRI